MLLGLLITPYNSVGHCLQPGMGLSQSRPGVSHLLLHLKLGQLDVPCKGEVILEPTLLHPCR